MAALLSCSSPSALAQHLKVSSAVGVALSRAPRFLRGMGPAHATVGVHVVLFPGRPGCSAKEEESLYGPSTQGPSEGGATSLPHPWKPPRQEGCSESGWNLGDPMTAATTNQTEPSQHVTVLGAVCVYLAARVRSMVLNPFSRKGKQGIVDKGVQIDTDGMHWGI